MDSKEFSQKTIDLNDGLERLLPAVSAHVGKHHRPPLQKSNVLNSRQINREMLQEIEFVCMPTIEPTNYHREGYV
jgi:hypothetical protein